MSAHTPEPWHVIGRQGYTVWADNSIILSSALPRSSAEGRANARLAAAAPDMYEALQEIIRRNEIQQWFNLDKARAAIAKAEGRE